MKPYKRPRFRIVPTAPNVYLVQRKGLLLWSTEGRILYDFLYPHEFGSKADARAYIDKTLAKGLAEHVHLGQPIEEYPEP